MVQRRPWPPLIAGLLILVFLALPVFSIRLGFSDEGNAAKDTTVRQSYDTIAAAFGPGSNGPLFLATTDPNANAQTTAVVTDALSQDPEVAFVQPAFQVGDSDVGVAGVPEVGTAGRGDVGPRRTAARRRAADDRPRRQGRRVHRRRHRLRRLPRRPAAAADRRGARPQLHPVDGRVPQPARAAQGGDPQPAVGRRGLRRDRRHLPVGLGDEPDRRRQGRAGRGVGADDALRHRLRLCRWTTRCSSCRG